MCEEKNNTMLGNGSIFNCQCAPHRWEMFENHRLRKNTDSSKLLQGCKGVQESWVLYQEKEKLRNRVIKSGNRD